MQKRQRYLHVGHRPGERSTGMPQRLLAEQYDRAMMPVAKSSGIYKRLQPLAYASQRFISLRLGRFCILNSTVSTVTFYTQSTEIKALAAG